MNRPLQIPGIDEEQIAETDSLLRANIADRVHDLAGMTWEERIHLILNDLWQFGLKVVVVVAIFIVGRWIIRRITRGLDAIFEKRHVDHSLRTFVHSLADIILYLVLFYLMIAWLGINTSLFVALFAAAGLAIGMAMSGVFQNFAGGVMILLLKPFKDGDYIEVQGQAGTVTDIRLFNTVLKTVDGKTILLPNGSVSTSIVNNYNVGRVRRLEWVITLAAGTDFEGVRKTLMGYFAAEPRILSPTSTLPAAEPEVVVSKLGAGSLEVTAWAWVASGDYLAVLHSLNERIYREFPGKGFDGPTQAIIVKKT